MIVVYTCSDGVVEPLDPPAGCKPGERVFVAGYEEETAGSKRLK